MMEAEDPDAPLQDWAAAYAENTSMVHRSGDPDFMLTLARGLLVLRMIADAGQPLSVSELATLTGLSRATVRRCVYTLKLLDYVSTDGDRNIPGPRLVALTSAFVRSSPLVRGAQPILDRLRDTLGQSISLGVFDAGDAAYVACAHEKRRWQLNFELGTRVPSYCTALGRALLAFRPEAQIEAYLATTDLAPFTARTTTSPDALRTILAEVRRQGYAISDQEQHMAMRAIATPVRSLRGEVVAAINVVVTRGEVGMRELRGRFLSALLAASEELGALVP